MLRPCNRCGKPIQWRRTKRNRWQPVNEDGEPHHSTCSRGRRAAVLVNKPIASPATSTRGVASQLYVGSRPPWSFSEWQWIEPADELRYQEWLRENDYHDDLFGDDLAAQFERRMQDDAA